MFVRSANTSLNRSATWPPAHTEPQHPPLLFSGLAILSACLTLLVMVVAALSRLNTASPVFDLPLAYAPGSLWPGDVSCDMLDGGSTPRCSVQLQGDEVFLNFDSAMTTILRTTLPARQYQIGQLIVAWGRPSGVTRTKGLTTIYWHKRSALVMADRLRPSSQIAAIVYELTEADASPWRGFRSGRD